MRLVLALTLTLALALSGTAMAAQSTTPKEETKKAGEAAKDAGFNVAVPFTGGRGDATQEWTDVDSFEVMEPAADGFVKLLQMMVLPYITVSIIGMSEATGMR